MKNSFIKIFAVIICIMLSPIFAYADNVSQLNRIENSIWGFTYSSDSDFQRLDRIEKYVFGQTSSNLEESKRIDKITKSLGLESEEETKKSINDLYAQEQTGPGVEYPQIDLLETKLLGNVYKKENIYLRLERLEQKVFGSKQEGDLASRTETLKKYLDNKSQSSSSNQQSSYQTQSYFDESYQVNPYNNYSTDEIKFQLSALENLIFATDFSQEPIPLRLDRLEGKIFQRTFSEDDEAMRIQRLQAAASASKTSKYYDNNKFQKFASTGMQAASFLLMILAFIL